MKKEFAQYAFWSTMSKVLAAVYPQKYIVHVVTACLSGIVVSVIVLGLPEIGQVRLHIQALVLLSVSSGGLLYLQAIAYLSKKTTARLLRETGKSLESVFEDIESLGVYKDDDAGRKELEKMREIAKRLQCTKPANLFDEE